MKYLLGIIFCSLLLCSGCKKEEQSQEPIITEEDLKPNNPETFDEPKPLTKQFKDYWYAGEAEISSYDLEQYRYGEKRTGSAVLIYVTEPFLKNKQVKSNKSNPENIPVLKLNSTKNFLTGIYPYSIMQSVFYPVGNNSFALKATASVQEWCGQTYTQLNNRKQFEVMSHSYFEGEADQKFTLEKTVLENELWAQLRIDPKSLPTGSFELIPSLEYLNLYHKPLQAYKATAELKNNSYSITYLEINRKLTINFSDSFPYVIESWEEVVDNKTSTGKLKTTIKSNYWNKNSNNDLHFREILQLQ